jgi:hypothetical protein
MTRIDLSAVAESVRGILSECPTLQLRTAEEVLASR